jgi:hypothetical protein
LNTDDVAKSKRARKQFKPKIPGQSWTIKEKLDVVNALCADLHFSHAEARAAVTMVLYFHNTTNGDLFPSRAQVSEQCGVSKDIVISATRKMVRFGYLHYEQSSGGRNERNTYHLKKLAPKVVKLHPETVETLDRIESETVEKIDSGGRENRLAPVENLDPQIPLEDYHLKKEGEASPSPCSGRASAPPEKKEEAFREVQGNVFPKPQTPTPPEEPSRTTEAEREAHLARLGLGGPRRRRR